MEKTIAITLSNGRELRWGLDFSETGTLRLDVARLARKCPWAVLHFSKCPCCPLGEADRATCPVADVLLEYAMDLSDCKSCELAEVRVFDDSGREVWYDLKPLQEVVSELIRLAVYQTACPVGRRVKPAMSQLALFPRRRDVLVSLARQFAVENGGGDASPARRCMQDLHTLFRSLGNRLSSAGSGDVYLNAVVVQDALSGLFRMTAPELIRRAWRQVS